MPKNAAQDQGLLDPIENLYPADPAKVVDEDEPDAAKEGGAVEAKTDDADPAAETDGALDGDVDAAPSEPEKKDEGDDIAEPAEGEEPEADAVSADGETSAIEEFDFGGKDFKDLTANVVVDGETKAIPIAEVLKGFQISEAGEKRLREADELKDQARSTLDAQDKQWKTNLEVLPEVAHLIAREEILELHRKNLEGVRQDDPAEYAARMLDINKAQTDIDQQKAGFSSQIMERTQQSRATQEQEHAAMLQSEMQQLLAARPELSDPKHWDEFTSNVVGYATKEYGLQEDDVRGVTNHSMLIILDKARKWDAAQGSISATRKKPTAAPKAMRPGAKSDRKPAPKSDVEILYGSG